MVIALSPFARTRTRWDKAPRLRDRDFGIGGGFGLKRVWRPVRGGCVGLVHKLIGWKVRLNIGIPDTLLISMLSYS